MADLQSTALHMAVADQSLASWEELVQQWDEFSAQSNDTGSKLSSADSCEKVSNLILCLMDLRNNIGKLFHKLNPSFDILSGVALATQDDFMSIFEILGNHHRLILSDAQIVLINEVATTAHDRSIEYDGKEHIVGAMFTALHQIVQLCSSSSGRSEAENQNHFSKNLVVGSQRSREIIRRYLNRQNEDEDISCGGQTFDQEEEISYLPDQCELNAKREAVLDTIAAISLRLFSYVMSEKEMLWHDGHDIAEQALIQSRCAVDKLYSRDDNAPLDVLDNLVGNLNLLTHGRQGSVVSIIADLEIRKNLLKTYDFKIMGEGAKRERPRYPTKLAALKLFKKIPPLYVNGSVAIQLQRARDGWQDKFKRVARWFVSFFVYVRPTTWPKLLVYAPDKIVTPQKSVPSRKAIRRPSPVDTDLERAVSFASPRRGSATTDDGQEYKTQKKEERNEGAGDTSQAWVRGRARTDSAGSLVAVAKTGGAAVGSPATGYTREADPATPQRTWNQDGSIPAECATPAR